MATALMNDDSPLALRPSGGAGRIELQGLCAEVLGYLQSSSAKSTRNGDFYHWKKWEKVCVRLNTSPWRTDIAANMGLDVVGYQREILLCCIALVIFNKEMSPRAASHVYALPQSSLNVLLGVMREHRRNFITMVGSAVVRKVMHGMVSKFIDEHGAWRLIPRQAKPMLRQFQLDLVSVPNGTVVKRGCVVDWDSLQFMSLKAMIGLEAMAGFRGEELVLSDNRGLSFAHVAYFIGGTLYTATNWPSAAVMKEALRRPSVTDFVIITPPTSKADPFGIIWGPLPIYLPYHSGELNAAVVLTELHLHFPPQAGAEAATPLFRKDDETSFTKAQLDSLLQCMLRQHRSPQEMIGLTWHSFRVFLAMALLECGASPAQIQALLRWQTEDSLRLYARLGKKSYGGWLLKAQSADISSVSAQDLPVFEAAHQMIALQREVM